MGARAALKRDDWLAWRKGGLGGSDQKDIFQLVGEGCTRRVHYDKSGTPADYPEEENLLMRRGRVLEDAAADEYMLKTGRKVVRAAGIARADAPWARVSVDRRIRGTGETPMPVLEIKTHGRSMFQRAKREGVRPAHVLQLQHALFVTGARKGAFALLHPDSFELLHFDIDRDEELIGVIQRNGQRFWDNLTNGGPIPPAPYKSSDAPCRACPWRKTCHGEQAALEITPEQDAPPLERDDGLDELVTDYALARAAVDEAEETLNLVKGALKQRLGRRGAVQCAAGVVYHTQSSRRTIDTKALQAKLPKVAAEFTRISAVQTLRVYAHRHARED